MTAKNRLIIMSDEHARRVMGCYGDPVVQTPHMDALAVRGTRFTSAYTPSPICVPARAAIATGLPVHQTGHWDNAHPYEGIPQGWAHTLRARGGQVVSIGKLHYRDSSRDTGFSEQILPMHVENGRGDIAGSIRSPLPVRTQSRALANKLGPGESSYVKYDRQIRDAACRWLSEAADETGWTLLVSFVSPHFPLIAPAEFYDLYRDADLKPSQIHPTCPADHPWLQALRGSYVYDNFDDQSRREALRNYYGLVSFLDANIGAVLASLDASGARDETDVIYFSDHGDNLGERGMWGKSTFFEDSVGVPLIYAPASKTRGDVCNTPVSLTDIAATLTGIRDDPDHLGHISSKPSDPNRAVISQYHAAGSPSGAFMLRKGRFKLCLFVGYAPMLFDLEADPFERTDLSKDPSNREILDQMQHKLCEQLQEHPVNIDILARADQQKLVAAYGGQNKVLKGPILSATSAPRD
ncbi:sulfatase-like hydrolase/transferase [Epibacterium ulvae]|uniref:sulfatase-like hydrolase/transferase n=1 Tax=Epibacterium ulvae TaxID=1156985 RepID=UPI001BFCD44C|nr:sulfatase-like hydrolase/transferase [Epibacterium ulvae]MBT8155587.1 sulfatase-like hydrolase/transferase [Epibacterium ulvae]